VRSFNGYYEAGGHKITFCAIRHDNDRWGITAKTARGQALMRETLGASPWSLLGETIDAALDLSRKSIVTIAATKPAQQQEIGHEQAQPRNRGRPRKDAGSPRPSAPSPAAPFGELGRPLDAASDRPVVGAGVE
jgi:hypothetical protein